MKSLFSFPQYWEKLKRAIFVHFVGSFLHNLFWKMFSETSCLHYESKTSSNQSGKSFKPILVWFRYENVKIHTIEKRWIPYPEFHPLKKNSHMLSQHNIWHWGFRRSHLKSSHLKRFGHRPKTYFGGHKKKITLQTVLGITTFM